MVVGRNIDKNFAKVDKIWINIKEIGRNKKESEPHPVGCEVSGILI